MRFPRRSSPHSPAPFNRKWLLAGGLTPFTIGMAGQALGSTYALVAARVLAAIGAAGFQSNAYVMAGADASDTHRGRAFATVAGGMSVSMVLGVPIGVLTGQWFGCRRDVGDRRGRLACGAADSKPADGPGAVGRAA
jgi:predicted MFS family arabinose efflux permease